MRALDNRKYLVVLSGGQDSATCLSFVKDICSKVNGRLYTVSFDYGQRHQIELVLARRLSQLAEAEKHYILPINTFQYLGNSALVIPKMDISANHGTMESLPASFVPGRNYIFLGFAAALAFKINARTIVTGVCQTDYSGYPDCRSQTIKSIQESLQNAMDSNFDIITPLMYLTKAETVTWMNDMDRIDWYAFTQTCYEGERPPCGKCPACELREKGFREAGVQDPLVVGTEGVHPKIDVLAELDAIKWETSQLILGDH